MIIILFQTSFDPVSAFILAIDFVLILVMVSKHHKQISANYGVTNRIGRFIKRQKETDMDLQSVQWHHWHWEYFSGFMSHPNIQPVPEAETRSQSRPEGQISSESGGYPCWRCVGANMSFVTSDEELIDWFNWTKMKFSEKIFIVDSNSP